MSSTSDFNYRKVAGKRKRFDDENFIDAPPSKKMKLEENDWFHNYNTLLNDDTKSNSSDIKPKLLSLPKKPLSIVNSNAPNLASLKLQPKSLELLERSQIVKKPKTNEQSTTKRVVSKKPLSRVNKTTTKTSKTTKKPTATKKKQIVVKKEQKPKRTKEQELFPFEGLEIFDRIYVGGVNVAKDRELIDQRNIKAIVNATKELPNYYEDDENFSYFKISVTDSIDSPLSKYFNDATAFMDENLKQSENNGVLVHCQMGQSRSPSVIIACM